MRQNYQKIKLITQNRPKNGRGKKDYILKIEPLIQNLTSGAYEKKAEKSFFKKKYKKSV